MLNVALLALVACCLSIVCSAELSVQQKLAEIEVRLKKHCNLDRSRCHKTEWGEKYAALHQKHVSLPTGKKLVAVPHVSGMADRIVGFTTGLVLAILTDRAFQMGVREHLLGFEQAFDQPNIKWQRPRDEDWLIVPLKENAHPRQYNQSVLDSKSYFAVNSINRVRKEEALAFQDAAKLLGGDAITTFLITNRGKTIRMFDNPARSKRIEELGLNTMTLFGCLVNYAIQPKREIFLPVFDQFEKMSRFDSKVLKISIQVRAGDHVWVNNTQYTTQVHQVQNKELLQSFQRFFSCAEQIETFVTAANPGKYSSVLWYLATDSKALRHAAVAHYGDKIVTSLHSSIEHSAKETSVCTSSAGNSNSVTITV